MHKHVQLLCVSWSGVFGKQLLLFEHGLLFGHQRSAAFACWAVALHLAQVVRVPFSHVPKQLLQRRYMVEGFLVRLARQHLCQVCTYNITDCMAKSQDAPRPSRSPRAHQTGDVIFSFLLAGVLYSHQACQACSLMAVVQSMRCTGQAAG